MKISKYQYKNDLICSVCGEIVTVIQSDSKKPKLFKVFEHECPRCNKVRKFIVIQDIETAKAVLSFAQSMTVAQEIVYKLINDKEKDKIK